MRKSAGMIMMATSVLLLGLVAWLLLRPAEAPGSAAASAQPVAITPNFTRLAPARPAVLVASPTPVAIAPVTQRPIAATVAVAPQTEAKRITPEELQRRLSEPNPPLVWELRSDVSYEKQHIPGSQLVQIAEVAALAQDLDRKQAIVLNCD